MVSHIGTRLRQRHTDASRQLWRHKRSPVRLARAHVAWRSGNHMDVATLKSSACPLAGWLVSRPQPGTTFYPCQSLGGLGTQYCVRQRRHKNRSSEAPHLSKRWVITRSLHGHFNQLASDIYARRLALSYLRPMRHSTRSPATSPSSACNPRAPSRRRRSPPARLATRLERFQACSLRNDPTLQIPPERNEQATGQGHDANAPHALTAQSKARIEPDAEGRVRLVA
jgi:hypothetical protein